MSRTTSDDQLKFLLSCVKYSNNGRINFEEVAKECGIVSKGAASKRYERLLKANGIHPSGGPVETPSVTATAPRPPKPASTRSQRVSGKRKGTYNDHGLDDDDEEKQERQPKRQARATEEVNQHAGQNAQWQPTPANTTTWRPRPSYVAQPCMRANFGTHAVPRSQNSMPQQYRRAPVQHRPSMAPAPRYVMQMDPNGEQSVILSNGSESIFQDFLATESFDTAPFLDQTQQSQSEQAGIHGPIQPSPMIMAYQNLYELPNNDSYNLKYHNSRRPPSPQEVVPLLGGTTQVTNPVAIGAVPDRNQSQTHDPLRKSPGKSQEQTRSQGTPKCIHESIVIAD